MLTSSSSSDIRLIKALTIRKAEQSKENYKHIALTVKN